MDQTCAQRSSHRGLVRAIPPSPLSLYLRYAKKYAVDPLHATPPGLALLPVPMLDARPKVPSSSQDHVQVPLADQLECTSTNPITDTQSKRPHCLVIYTGGTFGMVPNENGVLAPTGGFLEKKINEMDEFKFETMPRVTVSEWVEPIESSSMTPDGWVALAQEIGEKYQDFDGFVVLHGTDTMAYTASALSFMLENLGKPVVISGAMVPLHFPNSDARRNLIMSVLCAASLAIPEVCIYWNNKLLRGNRATKVANTSMDAFHSPNFTPLAETGVEAIVDQQLVLRYPSARFRVFTNVSASISVFYLVPGFVAECIEAYIERHNANKEGGKRKALVFALYGAGNARLRQKGFLHLVKFAIESGIPVAITSQCLQGRTQLHTYVTGASLLDMGVIASLDMTVECCVTKLAYLMGKGYEGTALKTKMETDLRGELSIADSVGNTEDMSSTARLLSVAH